MPRYGTDPYENQSSSSRKKIPVLAYIIGIPAAFVFLIWAIAFVFTGWKSTPPDKLAIHMSGGPIQGTHFIGVVPPGQGTHFVGLLEGWNLLPATQRTYIISANPNEGDKKTVDTVQVASKTDILPDGTKINTVPVSIEASLYFKLNTACPNPNGHNPNDCPIRDFYTQICLHEFANVDGSGTSQCTDLTPGHGWDAMLDQYLRPQVNRAIRDEAGKHQYVEMWHDPNVRSQMQTAIASSLAADINSALGGPFFCGPDSTSNKCTALSFILSAANPPKETQDAYTQTATSAQNVLKTQQDAQAKAAAAQGDADSQRIRASAPQVPAAAVSYIEAQAMATCANNGNCHLVIVKGTGTGTTVQVPGQ